MLGIDMDMLAKLPTGQLAFLVELLLRAALEALGVPPLLREPLPSAGGVARKRGGTCASVGGFAMAQHVIASG
jgi:hypothetical protein